MDEKTNESVQYVEDDLDMLPDGWGDGDDFFNVDSWTGASAADEQKDGGESQDEDNASLNEDGDDTTTADSEEASEDSTDAEKPTTPDSKGKLKFSATIDHESKDVELDEAELPTIYQKAQVTDRVQAKVAKMQPIYDQAVRTAKILGYDSVDEMLKAAEESYRDGEVDRLVSEGTQKDVAEDYVRRKMNDAYAEEKEEAKPEESAPKGRDYKAEVEDLLKIRPMYSEPGKRLPEEVTKECIETGRPLTVVYLEWEAKQNQAKYDALLKENKKLKQNAEAASRAPVRGVSRGGPAKDKANDDPFLKGFDSEF